MSIVSFFSNISSNVQTYVQGNAGSILEGISTLKVGSLAISALALMGTAIYLGRNFYLRRNLCHYCERGDIKGVRAAIDAGADVNGYYPIGQTPLHLACRYGHFDIAQLLIEKGASIGAKDSAGCTPLLEACSEGRGHFKVAQLLIERGADVNQGDQLGISPLSWASAFGNGEVAELLLNNGADVNKFNLNGDTALHMACSEGHFEIVRLLIEREASINATNNAGRTPLQEACIGGHREIAEFLLDKGADVNKASDLQGNTLLHLACSASTEADALALCEWGANPDLPNNAGETPRQIANRRHGFNAGFLAHFDKNQLS